MPSFGIACMPKCETLKRKKDAPPDSRESVSNEYWLGNEFKNGDKKLSDF